MTLFRSSILTNNDVFWIEVMTSYDAIKYDAVNVDKNRLLTSIKDTNYEYADDGNFFSVTDKTRNWGGVAEEQSPWKVHLSIKKEDVGKAWDLLAPFLIENGVPSFKVSNLTKLDKIIPELDGQQLAKAKRVVEGSQITIYIPAGKEKEYNALISEIEKKLSENNIQPGISDVSDRKVGQFASVRAAGVPMHSKYPYQNASDNYNPFKDRGLEDPFVKVGQRAFQKTIKELNKVIAHLQTTLEQLTSDEESYQNSKAKWGKFQELSGEEEEQINPPASLRQQTIASLQDAILDFMTTRDEMKQAVESDDVLTEAQFEGFCQRIENTCASKIEAEPELSQLNGFVEKFLNVLTRIVTIGFYGYRSDAMAAIDLLSKSKQEEERPFYSSPGMGG